MERLKPIKSNQEVESLDSLGDETLQSIAYEENSQEGVWRVDFLPPISLSLPQQTQVSMVFQNGVWGEANDAIAKQYGLASREELIGKKINVFIPESESNNKKVATDMVKAKFYYKDFVTYEKDAKGSTKVFLNNIVPKVKGDKVLYVWGASIEITELNRIRQKLQRTQKKLTKKNRNLKKKNIALQELISQIEIGKQEFKKKVKANIEKVLLPSLDRISVKVKEKVLIEQHREAIEDLASNFGIMVSDKKLKLTPREIEVCNMVKNGLTNKEIAKILYVSIHTVEKHRRMARKKLGLANKGINLRTYLTDLSYK